MPEILSVALNFSGAIVRIALSSDQIEKWIKDNNKDCVVYSFCSLSEYFEYLTERNLPIAILPEPSTCNAEE